METTRNNTQNSGVKKCTPHKRVGSTLSFASLNVSDTAARLDKMFFSYLGKLFTDLVDLKLRARRRASVKSEAGSVAEGPKRHQSSSLSEVSTSSSGEDSEIDLEGSFIIEPAD